MADDQELRDRVTKLEAYIEHQRLDTRLRRMDDRVDSLERWRYIILGATTLAATLFTLFATEIKAVLLP